MAAKLSKFGVVPTIAVKDMGRAKKFYEGVLGYEQMMGDDNGVVYEGKDGTGLMIYPSEFAGSNKATYAAWNVEDFEAVFSDLKDKGVEFEDYDQGDYKTENGVAKWEQDGKTMKTAWFKDPDGNILNIAQM